MDECSFKYYVLNYDWNAKKVINFNIFCNSLLNEWTNREVRKYLRSPSKYCHYRSMDKTNVYGFEGFCEELSNLIAWQEWGRREYEISVGDAFENDLEKFEKWDCYAQCKPNIDMIAREVIWQYKTWLKEKKNA